MPRRRANRVLGPPVAAIVLGVAAPAWAHAFGQRYDLPVPLGFYLAGAAAAVAVSFVVIGLFLRRGAWSRAYPRYNLLRSAAGRLPASPLVLFVVRLVSVGLLALVVTAGLFGNQHPYRNLAPVLVWIVWWVGMAYVSAFVGDLWTAINPLRAAFAGAEALYRRLTAGHALSRGLPYPRALGVWPAVLLLLAFAWVELIYPRSAVPKNIAWMILGYAAVTWTGMFLFGRERWLGHGEVFSLLFGLLARFAPMEIRVSRPEVCAACGLGCLDRERQCVNCASCFSAAADADREWALRPWAMGLLRGEPASGSMTAFVLLVLSTVLFDGLLATPAWTALESALLPLVPGTTDAARRVVTTFGLVGFWLVFLGAYLATCRVMAVVVGARLGALEIARRFVFTLVPIAIAYHLAHYLGYLLIQGQYVIPLASDPFGFGWDLLGTSEYRIDIAVVGAKFAWYTAVTAIVAGHIIAVYLAHVQAVNVFEDRRPALRSQYPMTALMVIYTVTSLSILAEPIVQRPSAAPAVAGAPAPVVAVPPAAVRPEPGTGRLRAVGPGKGARLALTYGTYASAYHDGTRTSFADILYAYAFAYRWGASDAEGQTPYDPEIGSATALLRARLIGIEFAGVDRSSKSVRFGDLAYVRELILVRLYVDASRDDLEKAASVAPPWAGVPWHVMALMEEAVARGWAAFSREEATRRAVPWLDLVRAQGLKGRLASLVDEFERQGYVPEPLKGRVTEEEARARWRALAAFYETHGHFLVTGGPYLLKEWSADATVLEVFRDPSYPLGVGSYDGYAIPRRAYIARVERRDEGLKLFVEVERVEKFMRSFKIVREPLRSAESDALARQILECRFVVVGADGRVSLAGLGRLESDGAFAIDLTGRLDPGRYSVLASLSLNRNTMTPDIRQIDYTVPVTP